MVANALSLIVIELNAGIPMCSPLLLLPADTPKRLRRNLDPPKDWGAVVASVVPIGFIDAEGRAAEQVLIPRLTFDTLDRFL
jgi:hypothetical protein